MKNIKVSFDTWIQLLGMLGVLGGLVFVGLEMRQSQTIAIGGQIQARNDAVMNFMSAPLEGNETALLFFDRYFNGYKAETNVEKAVFSQIQRVRIISHQNAWQQYNLGLLPANTFEFSKRSVVSMYDDCDIRPIIARRVTADFLEFLKLNSSATCQE